MFPHLATMFRAEVFVLCRVGAFIGSGYASFSAKVGQKVRSSSSGRRFLALSAAIIVLTGLLCLCCLTRSEQPDNKCPAPKAKQSMRGGPSALLAYSQQLAAGAGRDAVVDQCARWESTKGAPLPLEEVRSRLECQSISLRSSATKTGGNPSDVSSFRHRTRAALGAVHGIRMAFDTMQAKLRSFSGAGIVARNPSDAMIALGGLAGIEHQSREGLAILELTVDVIQRHHEIMGSQEKAMLAEAVELRTKLIRLLVTSVSSARMIAGKLPSTSVGVRHVQMCKPKLLSGLEQMAIDAVVTGSEVDAGVLFDAGHLMSEVGMASDEVPLFGAPAIEKWSVDAKGMPMFENIVLSERMLLVGFGGDQLERATAYITRLLKHAQFLSTKKMYDAATWRYHAAADLASRHGHHDLASSSLAQLSYMLSMHGEQEDALKAANDAMRIGYDSLASYLQVSLRLSLGELRTDAEVRAAKEQLKVVEGKLGSAHLEANRAALLSHFNEWGGIADVGTLSSCLAFGDVAQLLVCALGRLAYA